ncbi:MAG: hypothetical protein ACI8QD_000772 [Cyclobacteriaceae bacterium]|jgi:hypothetical protein
MLRIFNFCLSSILSLQLLCQAPVSFEETLHDFGALEEAQGSATYTFIFTNTSSDPVTITNVKASCGCTTPNWTRTAVASGGTGEIQAKYSTINRPGSFHKSLKINWSNGAQSALYIKGSVNPKPRTPIEDFPVEKGSFRAKKAVFNFGNMSTEKSIKKSFALYNDSDDTVYFVPEKHIMPDFITFIIGSDTVLPKSKVRVSFEVDPTKRDKLGFNALNLVLATTDELMPVKSYPFYVTMEEYFAPLTEQEAIQAPRLTVDDSTVDFGSMSGNTIAEKIITISNTGNSTLNIRQIDSNCDCVTFLSSSADIKSGKSSEVKVSFDASNRKGRQYKMISLFSNDPLRPTQTISIKANVAQ